MNGNIRSTSWATTIGVWVMAAVILSGSIAFKPRPAEAQWQAPVAVCVAWIAKKVGQYIVKQCAKWVYQQARERARPRVVVPPPGPRCIGNQCRYY